ncbi:MAG TPA: DEAD/DEAH box helicase, partial [Gemmataceae bacterium]|nr:DEAD/DEAH box helicase [Gemmataceae bacterium]
LPEAFGRFQTFLAEASKLEHDLRCYDDVLSFVAEVRDAERRRERLAEAFPRGIRSSAFKGLLKATLYDYQQEGALFAARAGRCLIGDEMGLGKTVQAIAAAEIMAKLFGVERVLIVCPTSLKHQWEREIERFVGRSVAVIGGLQPRRKQLFTTNTFYKITNYDTIYRDLDLIHGWSPDLVILDEAQRIKNWNTRAARSVKKIASPYAMVLTGTPLENRLEELVSIVQFVDRYRLGPTFRLLHDHQVRDENGRVVGYTGLDRIGKTLEPVLIRRQKDRVLDQLPERLDKNFFVPMTPQQMDHHTENKEIVARVVQKWLRCRFLSEADQRQLMIALQNMRMSCDSTYLLDHQTDFGVKADELATLLEEVYERPETKVVIFSQWLRMHELLVRRFEKRRWDHVLFHGGVPGPQRKGLVDRFRQDASCRAFLATDAGGVGLNLQHASVVINMDLPWNPAVLEQRIGRVHRLGQRQPVRVVNFVAQATIEEGVLSVLKFKRSLFAGVLDGGEKEVFLGGSRLKRFMETVDKATTAIPQAELGEAEPVVDSSDGRAEPESPEEAERRPRQLGETPAVPVEPWAGLLQTGVAFLQQLATSSRGAPAAGVTNGNGAKSAGLSLVRRDEQTGEPYLRLPVPSPEILEQALNAFSTLLQSLRR